MGPAAQPAPMPEAAAQPVGIAAEPTPNDLDWNMWLGQAKQAEYSQTRRQEFRWFYEYSGGKMTDWGAHHIDIAQWALGHDKTGPVKISGTGTFPPIVPDKFDWNAYFNGDATLPSSFNTVTEFHINMQYANGSVISVNNQYTRESDNTNFGNGILFEGSAGRIFVNRGSLNGAPVESMTQAERDDLNQKVIELYGGKQPTNHMENFFQAVDARKAPISDVVTHHRTMTCSHLCNIAVMLGRELTWDPAKEEFVGDEQAAGLVSRKHRVGFDKLT
jgi:predicted dehydrogenase